MIVTMSLSSFFLYLLFLFTYPQIATQNTCQQVLDYTPNDRTRSGPGATRLRGYTSIILRYKSTLFCWILSTGKKCFLKSCLGAPEVQLPRDVCNEVSTKHDCAIMPVLHRHVEGETTLIIRHVVVLQSLWRSCMPEDGQCRFSLFY